jgi:hypothetical protein
MDWIEAGARREVFYTELKPDNCIFQVLACNNGNVWNYNRALLDFRIEPAWYRNRPVQVTALSSYSACVILLYLFERQRSATLLSVRYDERLEERTRLVHAATVAN